MEGTTEADVDPPEEIIGVLVLGGISDGPPVEPVDDTGLLVGCEIAVELGLEVEDPDEADVDPAEEGGGVLTLGGVSDGPPELGTVTVVSMVVVVVMVVVLGELCEVTVLVPLAGEVDSGLDVEAGAVAGALKGDKVVLALAVELPWPDNGSLSSFVSLASEVFRAQVMFLVLTKSLEVGS